MKLTDRRFQGLSPSNPYEADLSYPRELMETGDTGYTNLLFINMVH